jgi:hypothetical protein
VAWLDTVSPGIADIAQSQVTNLVTDLVGKVSTANYQKSVNSTATAVDTFPRFFVTNTTPTSGAVYLGYFTPTFDITVSQITMGSGAASSALTLVRMGLYAVDASDNATLVAQTASDTTLFTSNQTNYTRSFSTVGGYPATYSLVAGSRYAVGFILVGTAGNLIGVQGSASGGLYFLTPRVTSFRTGQTDLTTTNASHSAASAVFWARVS